MKFLILFLVVITACADAQVRYPQIAYRSLFARDSPPPSPFPNSWNRKMDLELNDDEDWNNSLSYRAKPQGTSYSQREIDEFRERYERFKKAFDKFSIKLLEMLERLEQYTY